MRRSDRAAWLWRSSLAAVLAASGLLAPAVTPAVLAADGLDIKADATYRIDVDDAVVRVRIDVVLTNRTPNRTVNVPGGTRTTQYYYETVSLPLQEEARNVRATSGGSTLGTDVDAKEGYRLLVVRYPDLFYQRTRTIRVEYDLIAGKPRSAGDIRVGPSFATFTAWAFGDGGKSTVRVVMPGGFVNDGYGDELTPSLDDGRVILRSGSVGDPFDWYHVIVADRSSALTDVRIGTPSEPMVIHAWPEDTEWRDTVSDVLDDGVPVLKDLIGVDWPVRGDLDVYQVHTPLLEGYAGFYDPTDQEIRISEDLEPQTILHEASHAWFDLRFTGERWIAEGLAETYAAMALHAIDSGTPLAGPDEVSPDDTIAFPLNAWPAPRRIDDRDTSAKELYGYDASWTVMAEIVALAGDDGMRDVFAALNADTTAYIGDVDPEIDPSQGGWRRFLDLVQEVGRADGAEALFRDWVLQPEQAVDLGRRADARAAYAELREAGGSWAVPIAVRGSMARWDFALATERMALAASVLDDRDALAGVEATLGTTSPADVEARYEIMTLDEHAAALEGDLEARAAAATTLIETREALAVQPSLLGEIGLMGALPAEGFDAGVAAYAAGDLDAADAGAAATMAVLASAEAIGQERVVMAVAITLVVLLLLVVLVSLLVRSRRRRRRRLGLALAAAGASTTLAATPVPDGIVSTTEADGRAYLAEPSPTDPPLIEPPQGDRPPSEPVPGADAD